MTGVPSPQQFAQDVARKTSTESLIRQFAGPLVFGVVCTLAPLWVGIDSPWGLACFGLCGFTF